MIKSPFVNAIRIALAATSALMFATSVTGAAESVPTGEAAVVERALEMLQQGADGDEVVAMLEPLASDGSDKAQLLLGSMYVEGRGVPRDLVEGYAWLQIAKDSISPPFASHALKLLLEVEPLLSGSDLIRADQRVVAVRMRLAERGYETYGPALRHFTDERPAAFAPLILFDKDIVQLAPIIETKTQPGVRLGCGSSSARPKGCPAPSKSAPEPRCTGAIPQADTRPSSAPTDDTLFRFPPMPPGLRASGFGGTSILLAHVDRSGWICGVTLVKSSGEPAWDDLALGTVGTWRVTPAKRRGNAVESLLQLAVSARPSG